MLGLLIIAVLFTLYLLKGVNLGTTTIIPFSKKEIVLPVLAYIPFAIFVMLGTTNAVNLTDGIDGLSTSVSAIITTCLTVIAIILDVKEIVVFGSIIVGACLGFLIFNLNTAQVFMGDTGSLLLRRRNISNGFVFTNATNTLIIAAIPVVETLSVVLQVIYFKRTGGKDYSKWHHYITILNYQAGTRTK